jgi:hypothetical protein
MARHRLICGRTTFNLDNAFEVRTTPYQGYASSTVEGATLRRAAFHVIGSKRESRMEGLSERQEVSATKDNAEFFITNIARLGGCRGIATFDSCD